MSEVVTLKKQGDVAVVSLDNPPVNGLSFAVRTELARQLETAGQDDVIGAIVITGAGRMFSSGADIREFGRPIPFKGALSRERRLHGKRSQLQPGDPAFRARLQGGQVLRRQAQPGDVVEQGLCFLGGEAQVAGA